MTYLQNLPEYGLKLSFRPKFPFWGGLGRTRAFCTGFALSFAEQLGLSKSNWRRASRTFSKTALRLCRSFVGQGSLSHWLSCVSVLVVTSWCDEKVALYSRRDVGHPAGEP